MDLACQRYGRTPSSYLLSDSELSSLELQIDLWCAETGWEVEGLLKQTMDGRDEYGKKAIVPMYTLQEVLRDDFAAKEGPKRYRTAEEAKAALLNQSRDVAGEGEDSSIDIESVEDDY